MKSSYLPWLILAALPVGRSVQHGTGPGVQKEKAMLQAGESKESAFSEFDKKEGFHEGKPVLQAGESKESSTFSLFDKKEGFHEEKAVLQAGESKESAFSEFDKKEGFHDEEKKFGLDDDDEDEMVSSSTHIF